MKKLRIKRKAVLLEIKKLESILIKFEKNKQKLSNTISVSKDYSKKLLTDIPLIVILIYREHVRTIKRSKRTD